MDIEFEGKKIRVFGSMAEYVNGNRMMYMDIEADGELKNPFVLGTVPVKDSAFDTFENDIIIIGGQPCVRVDMCEGDYVDAPAYMLRDALNEEVFQIFVKVSKHKGVYQSDNRVFKTREDAERYMTEYYK